MSLLLDPRLRSRRRRVTRVAAAAGFVCLLALAGVSGGVWGAFSAPAANQGNELTAARDWVAPSAGASVIQKSQGGIPGYIRQGGTYRVYADVIDSGNPPSGIASVRSNLSAVTTAQTVAPLSFGTFPIGGEGYNYASGTLTANAVLTAGTYGYSLTSDDNATNNRTQSGFSVIVDNTAPTASAVQTANKTGGVAGRAELGDSLTLTYSEPIEPNSVLAGWDGSQTNVVLRIDNNVIAQGFNDVVRIYNAANASALPLGTVRLGALDYVSASRTFGVTGTPSTMTTSGNAITVTLGTASGSTTTALVAGTMTWFPAAGATDRAGNAAATTSRTESGSADKEF